MIQSLHYVTAAYLITGVGITTMTFLAIQSFRKAHKASNSIKER